MSRVAAYATRLAALPRALAILELHPAGLPLADLATELGVRPEARAWNVGTHRLSCRRRSS